MSTQAIKIVEKQVRKRFGVNRFTALGQNLAAQPTPPTTSNHDLPSTVNQTSSSSSVSNSNRASPTAHQPQQPANINPQLEKIKREIAILKKCNHPNVVGLKEVIDDPHAEKIYLVLEYLAGGDIKWRNTTTNPPKPVLTQDEARRVFRDTVCGLQYCKYYPIDKLKLRIITY
jgi:serine/threonine protein kinase